MGLGVVAGAGGVLAARREPVSTAAASGFLQETPFTQMPPFIRIESDFGELNAKTMMVSQGGFSQSVQVVEVRPGHLIATHRSCPERLIIPRWETANDPTLVPVHVAAVNVENRTATYEDSHGRQTVLFLATTLPDESVQGGKIVGLPFLDPRQPEGTGVPTSKRLVDSKGQTITNLADCWRTAPPNDGNPPKLRVVFNREEYQYQVYRDFVDADGNVKTVEEEPIDLIPKPLEG